ncbi:MAG: DEAD/DEAH box helicase family protein [Promethearchaeota archaeon]
MAKNTAPKLQDSLLLNKYFCSLFDFSTIEDAFRILKSSPPKTSVGGYLQFTEILSPHVVNQHLLENLQWYDQNIQEYIIRINKSRNPKINLMYFQYLAILFTDIYLHRYFSQRSIFLAEIGTFFKQEKIPTTPRFNKLAYWAATGSGKTIIMHINMLQWEKHCSNPRTYNNTILITPNHGLTQQHRLELTLSSIKCTYIDGMHNDHPLSNPKNIVVKMTEITKIKDHVKNLDGKSLPLEWFGQSNVVFIDEGHKGYVSETRVWKSLQSRLAGEQGFTFEYSATFGEIVHDPEVFWEYATSIIFDYRYRYFYMDGFGKDFEIFNLSNLEIVNHHDEYDEVYLTTALLSFYQQKIYSINHSGVIKQFHISNPLMVFVGSKVLGRKYQSDILQVIKFLSRFVSQVNHFSKILTNILKEDNSRNDHRQDDYKQDIFQDHFAYLKEFINQKTLNLENLHANMLEVLFNSISPGKCRLTELVNADGEIGLSLGDSFFGVINIGDTVSFLKLIRSKLESEVIVNPKSNFEESLFFDLDNPNSHLNFLIGSKKFIEGWNSYRVSTMVLKKKKKREGPQIIQLFGRGVRLYGYDNSLLRSSALKYSTNFNQIEDFPLIPEYLSLVETLNIFGLNANYMATFQAVLNKEFDNSLSSRDSFPGFERNFHQTLKSKKIENKIITNTLKKTSSLNKRANNVQGNELKQILDTQEEICINSSTLIHISSTHMNKNTELSKSETSKNTHPVSLKGHKNDLDMSLLDFQEIYLALANFCERRHYTCFYFTPQGLEKWISYIKYRIMGKINSKRILPGELGNFLSTVNKYAVLIYQNLFITLRKLNPNSYFLFTP